MRKWIRFGIGVIGAAGLIGGLLLEAQTAAPTVSKSRVMVFDLASKTSRLVYTGDGVWEAPNRSRDGRTLLVNSGGRLYTLPADGSAGPTPLALDPSYRCNNDHDWSADGTRLAFSASSPASPQSQVYVADADGRNPRLVVPAPLSYFHGWSPDGKYPRAPQPHGCRFPAASRRPPCLRCSPRSPAGRARSTSTRGRPTGRHLAT